MQEKRRPIIIGIAGGSGSGKTTLASALRQELGVDRTIYIPLDNYYLVQDHLPMAQRLMMNYDHPESLEVELLVKQLQQLQRGESIAMPIYDFEHHTRASATVEIPPLEIILVEGILVLALAEVSEMCDLKIYVDTPADIRFIRRLTRDHSERGMSYELSIQQYLTNVRPMHEQFVEPSKAVADVVVIDGGTPATQDPALRAKLQSVLK